MRYNKILPIIFFGFLLPLFVLGRWDNPANHYLNAYRKYLHATCPLEKDSIKHFVYFARDRDLIHDHAFLSIQRFAGAQIMYSWEQLESQKGQYDISIIQEDYNYLLKYNKKLFIQLQDATFNPKYKGVPAYLLTSEYDGGAINQREDNGETYGWVAKRWNGKVQERFALLLEALGKEFDGKIEGINLQETAIGMSNLADSTYSPEIYFYSVKANMLALKKAFPISPSMLYANFMPGEWLPWEDEGYLRSIYNYGEEIGVGLGGPDLMVQRKAQLNHALKMMHEGTYTVPLGIAIQDGNYIGKTGADKDYNEYIESAPSERENRVPLLHAFAKDFLRVKYMFWVNQDPYFTEDVIPCFAND